jgi:hypothetical protein
MAMASANKAFERDWREAAQSRHIKTQSVEPRLQISQYIISPFLASESRLASRIDQPVRRVPPVVSVEVVGVVANGVHVPLHRKAVAADRLLDPAGVAQLAFADAGVCLAFRA